MRTIWSPGYEVDIGAHVFPVRKYRLVRDRILERGLISAHDLVEPTPASRRELARIHTREYLRKIDEDAFDLTEHALLELPFSPALRDAMTLCCGGTLLCARIALDDGIGVHLGGGFHHAFADHGEGFCLLNDVAVAARAVLDEGAVTGVAIVDLDVHQGNGTAAIFAGDPRVFTFSMHQERNYPLVKPAGDLDVGLDDGTDDETYLDLLARNLPRALDRPGTGLVFYLAGADPYRADQLGGLALTREGLRRRDRLVFEACRARGIPVAVTLAGGYAVDTDDTVEIHCATVAEAVRLQARWQGTAPEG